MSRAGVFAFVVLSVGGSLACNTDDPFPTGDPAPIDATTFDASAPDVPAFDAMDGNAMDAEDAAEDVATDVPICIGDRIERCNGVDDDCDGERDEGCTCLPEAPVPIEAGFHLSLAVSGGTIATSSQDSETRRTLSIRRYTSSFAPLGDVTTLVMDDTRLSNDPMLFPLGADFGAVWREWPSITMPDDEAVFARITDGVRDVGPIRLTPDLAALGQSVAPYGAGFVLARNEGGPPAGVAVRIVDRDGVILEGPHPLLEERSVTYNGVGAVGSTIGVAYQSTSPADTELRFARFDASAMPMGPSIAIAPSGSFPHVAAQSSGWGIIWNGPVGIWFAAVALDGSIRVTPRLIIPSAFPSAIAADGAGGWGVAAWGSGGTKFVLLDGSGATVGEAEVDSYFVVAEGTLAYDGTRFIAAVYGRDSALWVPCTGASTRPPTP